jgi:hypothetical protein
MRSRLGGRGARALAHGGQHALAVMAAGGAATGTAVVGRACPTGAGSRRRLRLPAVDGVQGGQGALESRVLLARGPPGLDALRELGADAVQQIVRHGRLLGSG